MSKQTAQASVAKHEATRDNQAQAQATATDARGNTSKSKESQSTTKTSGSYFTGTEWAFYATIIVVGLILRWTLLDMRPYHHDESLHGMYGRYFYDFPNANFYKYDPMLHGPMLYNSMRFIYAMFGDSLWAARTPVCLMGSLFMLVPYLYRKHLKSATTLILTGVIAFSPTMVYWSRFLREDYWVISGMLFVLFGFTLAPRAWKPFLVGLGITIQW
jgi:predicted membrane-bound mannosyltransferase